MQSIKLSSFLSRVLRWSHGSIMPIPMTDLISSNPTPSRKIKKSARMQTPAASFEVETHHQLGERVKLTPAILDKYRYYMKAVQDPDSEIELVNQTYQEVYGKAPEILREDFCGTGALACKWAQQSSHHKAIGVDLDPEPLTYGYEKIYRKLSDVEKSRMTYIQGNVLDSAHLKADVVMALNFSYFIFKTRAQLLQYFKAVRESLHSKGAFYLDLMGGWECQQTMVEKHKKKGFVYLWECKSFNPITHECEFAIHIKPKKGKKLKNLFTYDWRLWSIPELRELLAEAGFSQSRIYWEGDDEQGGGNGTFSSVDQAENCEVWISYIMATP